ncbi:predicted protein [Uncinocarpus reesii 1704]|uniref:Xylanolytic transcriptional activator regulatory domain-containing protein n=1 Tax=Uncinocarpus reesii (strain UAMH 1704) TaxID=336963 RepID=C4JH00_UNCRE|nr:uncharacterized protein UREG_01251 [Uncinocarpus reesii 1704]EEP76402.1 predicted protein [Uncinocarpus reesii 1704]
MQASDVPFNGHDAYTCLRDAGVGHTVTRELEDHLIKLFLSWENPFIHVVDEELFMEARAKALSENTADSGVRLGCYNQVLVNAMCAIGAAFTDQAISELPTSLSEFFQRRARVLLDADMANSSIATVQALAIMSAHEAAVTRDARGWLYSGMAMRLAVDLGLHLNSDPGAQREPLSDQEDVARCVTFWGIFIVDLNWSYYVGRLSMHIELGGIKIPKLSQSLRKSQNWEEYTDEALQEAHSSKLYDDPLDNVLEHQVNLYQTMRRLQLIFSDRKQNPLETINARTEKIITELRMWKKSLPSNVSDPENSLAGSAQKRTLPHVLLLHMQYHELMIFANHPLIAAADSSLTAKSIKTCNKSARAITFLLQVYSQTWSLRRMSVQGVHMIFSAALVHLLLACTSNLAPQREIAVANLKACCEALKELSTPFRSASRALDSLSQARQKWQASLENDTDTPLKLYFRIQQPISDPEIWQAVDKVICKGSHVEEDDPQSGDVSWLEGWMTMSRPSDSLVDELSRIDPRT